MPLTVPSSGGGAAAATQAEQETATSTTAFVSPGRQQFNPCAAKAWVRVDVSGFSVTSSYNISSVDDDGTGLPGVNFNVDFSGTSYAFVAYEELSIATLNNTAPTPDVIVIAAGNADFRCNNAAGTAIDVPVFCAVFFGDQ